MVMMHMLASDAGLLTEGIGPSSSRVIIACLSCLMGSCKGRQRCASVLAESLSTLKFANRAKNIKNAARLNEDVDQRTLLRKYERELKRLRAELLARQASLVDARRLLQVGRFLETLVVLAQ